MVEAESLTQVTNDELVEKSLILIQNTFFYPQSPHSLTKYSLFEMAAK